MSDVHRKDVELYRGLEPVLGSDVATMLLERLPPPQEDLATTSDLNVGFAEVDRRFEQVDRKFAEVDRKFEQVDRKFDEVDRRFDQAARELDLKLAAQSADLKGFVHEIVGGQIQAQTRTILFGMAGIMVGATTLAAALGNLL